MNALLHALATTLEPFHRVDPAGWFAWRTQLGQTALLICMAVGAFCLAIGAHEKLFRLVAVPLGVLLGVALTPTVVALIGKGAIPPALIELALPAALGVLAGVVPQTIAFVALGAVGAVIGTQVVAEHELLIGALPGFFIAGVLGIVFSRFVDTLSAAAFGALLLVGGALGAFGNGPLKALGSSPWVPVVAAAVLTAAGASLQLVLFSNPEARAERKAAARDAKQRAKDDKVREKRFETYRK